LPKYQTVCCKINHERSTRPSVLSALKEQGIVLAVATPKQVTLFFSATRTSNEAQSKPSPDMLHQLLEELGLSAQDAVMIGGTQIDMTMAKAAGMDRIGVTMGVHGKQQLNELDPIATVDNYLQLQQVLLG
jgi:phosphoglycolate phosphatase